MTPAERLLGPHEWGYRDLAEGGFISDDAPFDIGEKLESPTISMLAAATMCGHGGCTVAHARAIWTAMVAEL